MANMPSPPDQEPKPHMDSWTVSQALLGMAIPFRMNYTTAFNPKGVAYEILAEDRGVLATLFPFGDGSWRIRSDYGTSDKLETVEDVRGYVGWARGGPHPTLGTVAS